MSNINPDDIQPARKFAAEHPNIFPTATSLDYMLRNRNVNGLAASGALVKLGRAYGLHVPKFLEYIASRTV